MDDQYMSLITDYIDGVLTSERKKEFDQYVKEGHIDLKEIEELKLFENRITKIDDPQPSAQLDENFYSMLQMQKDKQVKNSMTFSERVASIFESTSGRWAFAASILFIGIMLGKVFTGSSYQKQMDTLSTQMTDMQEMIALTMLEESSVSKRLQGVQMSSELVSSNSEVADALLLTLNNDESSNVRLAALRMLAQYSNDERIREGLINSIENQDSPVVLMAMAELMVELQEEKAVPQFKNILEGDRAPEEFKTSLRENLNKIM